MSIATDIEFISWTYCSNSHISGIINHKLCRSTLRSSKDRTATCLVYLYKRLPLGRCCCAINAQKSKRSNCSDTHVAGGIDDHSHCASKAIINSKLIGYSESSFAWTTHKQVICLTSRTGKRYARVSCCRSINGLDYACACSLHGQFRARTRYPNSDVAIYS